MEKCERIMKRTIVFIVYIIFFSIKVNAEEFKVFYSGFSFTGNYSDKTATIKLTDQILKKKVDKKKRLRHGMGRKKQFFTKKGACGHGHDKNVVPPRIL